MTGAVGHIALGHCSDRRQAIHAQRLSEAPVRQPSPCVGLHGGGGVQVAAVRRQEVSAAQGRRQRVAVRLLEQAGRDGAHIPAACSADEPLQDLPATAAVEVILCDCMCNHDRLNVRHTVELRTTACEHVKQCMLRSRQLPAEAEDGDHL